MEKVIKVYGIPDKKKLSNYLIKNKHNNLTTIYYLALKNKNNLSHEIEDESQEEKNKHVTKN